MLRWGALFFPPKVDDLILVVVTFKPTPNVQTLKRQNSVGKIGQLIGVPLAAGASHGTTSTMVNPALLTVRPSVIRAKWRGVQY